MPLIDDLTNTAARNYEDWKSQARLYGTISSIVRPVLIICTALVAAQKVLEGHVGPQILTSLSIVVAIGTSLDAWLKPREKWRGFLTDRDAANILLMKARNTDSSDSAKVDALLEELRQLQRNHVEKNVY